AISHLRRVLRLADAADRSGGTTGLAELLDPVGARVLTEDVGQEFARLLTVRETAVVGGEARIVEEIRALQHMVAHALPLALVADDERDETVRRVDRTERLEERVSVAMALRLLTEEQVMLREICCHADGRIDKGEVDELALSIPVARTERREDGLGRE